MDHDRCFGTGFDPREMSLSLWKPIDQGRSLDHEPRRDKRP